MPSPLRITLDPLGLDPSKDGLEWVNLTQMTIISTTVSKNPLEEMKYPSQSTNESEMQNLDAISKTTE